MPLSEILPQIFRWSWLSPPHGYNFNGHLLLLPGLTVCVDPVQADEATISALAEARPSRILLTNRNHGRMANLLRERTGARTAIHPADATHARSQGTVVDEDLSAGQQIGPLRVVGVPGKSPGEIALHWPERRILLVGDSLIGNPPGKCSLLREQVLDDPARLRESVRGLLQLDFDTLLVGDGEPILQGAHRAVEELARGFA